MLPPASTGCAPSAPPPACPLPSLQAYKILNSARARQAINTLQARLKWVLALLVAAHVGCFAVSLIMINSSMVGAGCSARQGAPC